MNGREDKKCNDLFYTCSLIEYISRKTHNHPAAVANALGKERIAKIYDLADIYHSDNIDRVSDDFIAFESGEVGEVAPPALLGMVGGVHSVGMHTIAYLQNILPYALHQLLLLAALLATAEIAHLLSHRPQHLNQLPLNLKLNKQVF